MLGTIWTKTAKAKQGRNAAPALRPLGVAPPALMSQANPEESTDGH